MSFEEWFSQTHILSEDDKLGAFAGWTAALENTSRVVEFDLTDQRRHVATQVLCELVAHDPGKDSMELAARAVALADALLTSLGSFK